MAKRPNKKARLWSFTAWGDLPACLARWKAELADTPHHIVCQEEVTQKGKHHLQAVFVGGEAMDWDAVRSVIGTAGIGWLAISKKTCEANYCYCTKEATRVDGPYYINIHGGFIRHLVEESQNVWVARQRVTMDKPSKRSKLYHNRFC